MQQGLLPGPCRRPAARGRCHQRACVGVDGALVNRCFVAIFHHLAQVHDQHIVCEKPDHFQVMGNEQVGQTELSLQVGQQIHNLGLDRHVQCGYRLICNQQRGFEHQSAGDRNPLALSTGKHMGVASDVLRPQADLFQHGLRSAPTLGCIQRGVDLQRPFQNLTDTLAGIERTIGILEHHLDHAAQGWDLVCTGFFNCPALDSQAAACGLFC